jgi:GNAT superfamily N-acetyltransferase
VQGDADSPDDPPFDGDPSWRVERTLRDGTKISIRGVGPDDREEIRRGFLALSPETRYFRFLEYGAKELSDDLLTYLTDVDQKDHVAIGAGVVSPDLKTERGIGIARFIRLADSPDTAEAAVTVSDDMQRRGVGAALLRELLRAAEVRGIKNIRADVLANNATMRGILEKAGARVVPGETGGGTITYDLALAPPSVSMLEILRTAAETMAIRLRARF